MAIENGVMMCNDEIIPEHLMLGMGQGVRKVVIGPRVQRIGASAFSGCRELQCIEFEEGVQEIGMSAFGWCENLESICLPNSLRVIGGGAFVNCVNLKSVTFKEGGLTFIKLDRMSPFRNCVGRAEIENSIRKENERRACSALNNIFDILVGENHPDVKMYKTACEKFEKVDWGKASEEELTELFYARNDGVADLGKYASCSLSEDEWSAVDKEKCRQLCVEIVGGDASSSSIEQARRNFNGIFGGNKRARFNRVVASLIPREVVQLAGDDAMRLVFDWMVEHNLLSSVHRLDDWYDMGHAIRIRMNSILSEKSIYESGVLCWLLAEALRGTNREPERVRRMAIFNEFLKRWGF